MNEDLQVTPNLATDTWLQKIEGVDWRRKWTGGTFGGKSNGRFEHVLEAVHRQGASIWGV